MITDRKSRDFGLWFNLKKRKKENQRNRAGLGKFPRIFFFKDIYKKLRILKLYKVIIIHSFI